MQFKAAIVIAAALLAMVTELVNTSSVMTSPIQNVYRAEEDDLLAKS